MPSTYIHLARDVLLDSETPLQLGQIWNLAKQKGLDKKLESENPRKQALSNALHSQTRRESYEIFAFSKNPTLFGIEGKHEKIIPEEANDLQENETKMEQEKSVQKERSLHPLFVCLSNLPTISLSFFARQSTTREAKSVEKGYMSGFTLIL